MWSPSQASEARAAKRRPLIYPTIDLSALVGVSLVLIVIFMIAIPPPSYHRRTLDLPRARHAALQPGAIREDAIRIAVTRDGKVFFGSKYTAAPELPNLIGDALRYGAERKAYLLVDARAWNIDVEMALDQVRRAGISNVVILASAPAEM